MKFLIALVLISTSSVYAANLTLNGGESATIKANVDTTVTCAGNGSGSSDCTAAGNAFKKSMEYCYKDRSGGVCADKLWPKFRDSNPGCAYAGVETCLNYCYKDRSGGVCADLCQ